jgi:hypothetical protein
MMVAVNPKWWRTQVHETLVPTEILVQDSTEYQGSRPSPDTRPEKKSRKVTDFGSRQCHEEQQGAARSGAPMRREIVKRVRTDPAWERIAVEWGGGRGERAARSEEPMEGLEWVRCGASRPDFGRWSVHERGFDREMG